MSKFEEPIQVKRYSLGAEEFSLILSMTGKSEQGRQILAVAHSNLDQLDFDALLSSASHSLLARGLSYIATDGNPVLDRTFEKAIQPFLKYDQIFALNLVGENGPIDLNIYIDGSKSFCAHLIKSNVVHLLECASYCSLNEYLINILGDIVFQTDSIKGDFETKIPLSVFPGSLQPDGNQPEVATNLSDAGWPSEQAGMLVEDLNRQIVRGVCIKVVTNNAINREELMHAGKRTMLFLRGIQRTWVFAFDSLEPTAIGLASLVDQKGFNDVLADFI